MAISQQVLRRSPNFGPAHYSLAVELFMAGQGRKALDHLDQGIDRDPFDMLRREYRIYILYSLGDYEAIRSAARKCGAECGGITRHWLFGMVGFATPAQYREDFPLFVERAAAQGRSAAELAQDRGIADALILGQSYRLAKLEGDDDIYFVHAAIAARLVGFEKGLRYARVAADRHHPDGAVELLNDGRLTFTPEQRADPRYHQLFRHPRLIRMAAARRKAGVTAGLPVFPVKPYTGR